jgi:molybdopterin molybdotransferase
MLSVTEALERILKEFRPVEAEAIPLALATGRVLAENVTAGNDLPLFDNSSVDGFALIAGDPAPGSVLTVVDDIRAGDFSRTTVRNGECARIMTGAALPPGADAVIMLEDTDFNELTPGSRAPARVTLTRQVQTGENVRRRGDDLRSGEAVLQAGHRLRAQDIGLLAMLGISNVPVHRRPRLALLSSGNELLAPDQALEPGKIRDANSYVLASLAEQTGTELIRLGVAADDETDVRYRLEQAVRAQADVIVSSAGVSVGAFDYVKTVIEQGGGLEFWKVNMRPGKPLAFGLYQSIPFFGLPGNPVSAFIGFEIFVRPALEKLSGAPFRPRSTRRARLLEEVRSDGRESYLRGIAGFEHGETVVRLTGHQGSGNLLSLVQSNALLILPSGVKCVPANSEVDIWLLT